MVTSGSGAAGSGGQKPRAGYYPDPSIPGYVRYWNGSAWVPGSSRPEPRPGEVLSPPPGADEVTPAAPAAGAPAPLPAPVLPAQARTPSVEESGAMFLDEDPEAPVAQTPAEPGSGRTAAPASGPGFPTASGSAPPAQSGYGYPGGAGTPAGGYGYPGPASGAPAAPATPTAPASGGYGYPNQAAPGGGYGYPQPGAAGAPGASGASNAAAASGEGASWQNQVRELARQDGAAAVPGQAKADDGPPLPWRPPVSNPFLLAAQEQARPAAPGRRLAARLVDGVLVGAVVTAAATPLLLASVRHLQNKIDAARQTGETVQVWLLDGTTGLYLGIVVAAVLLAGLLYEVLPTVKWGRTLGKKLLGLRVLDIESQLTPGFGQVVRRMLVQYGLQMVAVGVLDAVWCLFDRPWRQCWHDKAARTFVAGGDDTD